LRRTGADGVDNFAGWLTTVVGRVCLDMLRSRRSRREEPLEERFPEPAWWSGLDILADPKRLQEIPLAG
jgi:DNA-directed RNA polymerase specialized sigma24 family protein